MKRLLALFLLLFVMLSLGGCDLFGTQNGDTVVEGSFWMAQDGKTIYLYVTHDPYSKVTKADMAHYDTTFDIYYPPDLYLRGDFTRDGSFVINELYHHTESPIETPDEAWVLGTYEKK